MRTSSREPFRVIVADPPWRFGDSLPGKGRGAAKHYGCLDVDALCAFPLPVFADDAVLLLWRVSAMPEEALRVCRAWGFVPKSEIIWLKKTSTGARHFGMGRYVRAEHETCIVASRGRGNRVVRVHNIRSTFEAPVGRHSEKPEVFYDMVETWLEGPYVELFARRKRHGWDCIGNELDGSGALDCAVRRGVWCHRGTATRCSRSLPVPKKIVFIPERCLGETTNPQTIRKRPSDKGQGRRNSRKAQR